MKLVFYFPDTPHLPASLRSMPNEDVSAIVIRSDLHEEQGTIEFFKKDGSGFSSEGVTSYAKNASLYGAIFSENKVIYECAMKKALLRLNYVTQLYNEKLDILANEHIANCDYGSMSTPLSYIEADSGDLSNPDILDNLGTIYSYATDIKNKNRNLKLKSCPLLY